MEVIYGLIPAMIILGLAMLAVLVWAVKSGQYDDMEGDASRILMDDDEELFSKLSQQNNIIETKQSDKGSNTTSNTIN